MNAQEAREFVQAGLDRRKLQMLDKERQLDIYEAEMITRCNQHCAKQKKIRTEADIRQVFSAEERAVQKAEEKRDWHTYIAIKRFIWFCVSVMMITTWTPLEWWGALALVAGAAVFPAAYIFRLYYPIEEV